MAKIISDNEIDNLAKEAGKEANKQDKVRVRIPIDKLNPKNLEVPVTINGYTWVIKRGESVSVPEEVSNILIEAGYI